MIAIARAAALRQKVHQVVLIDVFMGYEEESCDIDSLFAKEYQVKESAEVVIEQIDTMKKAILARAFRGELGTNDPSEESAVELLKKILNNKGEIIWVLQHPI